MFVMCARRSKPAPLEVVGYNPFLDSPIIKAWETSDQLEGSDEDMDSEHMVRRDPQHMRMRDMAQLLHRRFQGQEYKFSKSGLHELLCTTMDNVLSGKWTRVIISVPPQHGKTQIVKYASVLALARNPKLRIVYGSYGQQLASESSQDIREMVYSEWFQRSFNIHPHKSVGSIDNWKTEHGGGFKAVGVGVGLTGRSADLVWLDDLHKDRTEANSDIMREKVKKWYTSTLRTRIQGDQTSICLIMTRWHEDDVAGWLQALDAEQPAELKENWVVIRIPALAEEDGEDLLGRSPGEPLFPEKFTKSFYLKAQAADPLEFEALYQGNPTIAAGDLFLLADFMSNGYSRAEQVPAGEKITSWDTAQKETETSDFTAWVTAVIDSNKHVWVIDFGWRKMQTPYIKPAIEADFSSQRPEDVVIEDKSSGIGVLQEFRISNRAGVPIRPYKPGSSDKVLRSVLLQGKVRAGHVHVPLQHPKLAAWLSFFTGFPNAKHDDPVDALTQLTNAKLRPSKKRKFRSVSRAE